METQKKFNKRAFTSVGMFMSIIGLPFSGYMNHLLGFDTISTERHIWMSVHNILGIFFLFFSTWHIILNWKSLKTYLKKASNIFISKETVYAVSLVLFFLMLAIFHAIASGSRI
jgi:succinate dehydrogenase/fumarate reductase cytochrome b subunit